MQYRVSMPRPHAHLFEVEAALDAPGISPVFALPVWTPGSYLVREYARHVEGLAAFDGAGRPLAMERLDKHRVQVHAAGADRVVLRYRVYANDLTVRTAHLDGTHGYLNGAAVFYAARGRESERHVVEIVPPPGWHVSTALEGGPTTFAAPDYDSLVDSPFEIGTHRVLRFTALRKPHEIALWGRARADEGRLADDARRVVETLGALMGGLPYDRYLFIVHLVDKRRGGLEHARSTTLGVGRADFFPRERYEDTVALFAHEFFHLWNVKRLRPAALVPFDYGREQYTRLLWWFEGATSYYERLALVRSGVVDAKRHLVSIGEALTSLARTPGARKMSLEEASFLAWVKYYRPDENTPNSAVSYYLKGELVALALDLALRRAGRSLDELLTLLYARYGQSSARPEPVEGRADEASSSARRELVEGRADEAIRGVPEDAIERLAAELLGEKRARAFFDRHVRGTADLALDLDFVGLRLRRRASQGLDDKGGRPPRPDDGAPPPGWLGADIPAGPKLVVKSVLEGSPAEAAGLYAEDEIVAEDGFRVDRARLWELLQERGPGGALRLTVFRRDELVELEVPLAPCPEDAVWLEPVPDATPEQRAAFEAWTGAKFPAP